MRVCLMIEGQEGVTWEQWVALGRAAEEHGFDALFRSDHYLPLGGDPERGSLDAWVTLSALGAVTESIRLGTLVSPVTFRHPSVLAKSVVTADHVSGGRVELGIGAGWNEREHRAYGFPFPPMAERMAMLEEQTEIVHRLWDREELELTFEGRHYSLEGVRSLPEPVQDPHPPLIVGGRGGTRSARVAARWADEYNVNFRDPSSCRRVRTSLDRACSEEGRDPDSLAFSLMTQAIVGRDRGEVEARAGRLMERAGHRGDPAAFVENAGEAGIVGTVDQVLERLAEYAESGIGRVMLQHLDHPDLDMVALVGDEVIPAAASV
jgi:F420-dependent oxidoreductase-like protein